MPRTSMKLRGSSFVMPSKPGTSSANAPCSSTVGGAGSKPTAAEILCTASSPKVLTRFTMTLPSDLSASSCSCSTSPAGAGGADGAGASAMVVGVVLSAAY